MKILAALYLISPIGAFIGHTLLLVSRMVVLARPPVTSMAESLLFVPWIAMCGALIIRRGRRLVGLAAAVILCFAYPDFEPVAPVLNSNMWLSTHVILVVSSYGLFLLAALFGHAYLIKPHQRLTKLVYHTLFLGTAALIAGTLLGGVWAAQSWGRFWDWDPKESWAFISICCYLVGIHAYTFGHIKARGLAMTAALGFLAITFTWYGVNYILGTGLHSYGFGSGGGWIYGLAVLGDLFILSALFFKNSWVGYLKRYDTGKRGRAPRALFRSVRNTLHLYGARRRHRPDT